MTEKVLYWVTTISAVFAFTLFLANTLVINWNQRDQAKINQMQMVMNTAQRVMPLNQQLSNALYDTSVKNNDAKIRELLVAQGFQLPEKQGKAAPVKAEPAAKATKPAKEEE